MRNLVLSAAVHALTLGAASMALHLPELTPDGAGTAADESRTLDGIIGAARNTDQQATAGLAVRVLRSPAAESEHPAPPRAHRLSQPAVAVAATSLVLSRPASAPRSQSRAVRQLLHQPGAPSIPPAYQPLRHGEPDSPAVVVARGRAEEDPLSGTRPGSASEPAEQGPPAPEAIALNHSSGTQSASGDFAPAHLAEAASSGTAPSQTEVVLPIGDGRGEDRHRPPAVAGRLDVSEFVQERVSWVAALLSPSMIRRAGRGGEAEVRVSVNARGYLTAVRLERVTGAPALDSDVEHVLRLAEPYPAFSGELPLTVRFAVVKPLPPSPLWRD